MRERTDMEALYREYFLEVRKFAIYPVTPSYDNVIDFAIWLQQRGSNGNTRTE